MHEFSIATAVIDQLVELAASNGLVRVTAVAVTVGVRQQVEFESLAMALEAVSTGTIAEGATFTLSEEAMQADCGACGQHYAPVLRDFRCPACGKAEAKITGGNTVCIASLTGDDGKE